MVEIVCPGYGRTGTRSMQLALEILGLGPCYHMLEILSNHVGTHPQLWIDGYQGRGLAIKEIFDGYNSVADWPAADFHQEILQAYPNAKVILTLRDPDSWWESVRDSIYQREPIYNFWGGFFVKVFMPHLPKFTYMIRHIATLCMNEEDAKADYVRHNAEINARVPADKLLEFSVKDGWEPLCSFLEMPVPDVPFPWVNSREELQKMVARFGWILLAVATAFSAFALSMVTLFVGRWAGMAVTTLGTCFLSWRVMEVVRLTRFFRENPRSTAGASGPAVKHP